MAWRNIYGRAKAPDQQVPPGWTPQGSAQVLPFPDGSFDAVVSQFGLMFFPDPVAALREMMRALGRGGRLAVAVWASLADTPAYAAEVALVERLAGRAAADALRAPFELGDPGRMAQLYTEARITGARVTLERGLGRFSSIRTMVEVDVRDWLPIAGITLDDDLIERILQESEVVSQFGLMFFPDPVAALREMMRVLAPGGRLAVAVWGSLADTPAYAAEVALVERLGGRAAVDALRAPFTLGDVKRMAELCAAAGIQGARVALQPGRGRFPSIRTLVEVDVRDWLHIVGVALDEGVIETILQESETALLPFLTVDERGVGFDSPAVLATATR